MSAPTADAVLATACRQVWVLAGRSDPLPGLPGDGEARLDGPGDEEPSAWLERLHAEVLGADGRRRAGAHYTPPELVDEVLGPALDPLLDGLDLDGLRPLRLVDPACGPGAFLLGARRRLARALRTAGHPDPDRAALEGVLGVDQDPWAATIARLRLALDADAPVEAARVLAGEALLGPTRHEGPCPAGSVDWRALLPEGADAVIGNPPFLGGKRLRTELGVATRDALLARRPLSGNADLAAHFVHLAAELLRPGGRMGLVLTDTIGQGDTRRDGLGRLVPDPLTVVRATRSRRWPGQAHVFVAVVHAIHGPSDEPRILDGRSVARIGSHLRSDPLEDAPPPHDDDRPGAYIGCDLKGPGFLVGEGTAAPPATLTALRAADPHLDAVLRPYVTGRTLTDRPDGVPRRQVLDLTGLDLEAARARHPAVVAHLERTVRPDRATRSPAVARAPWWRFWRVRQRLRDALAPLDRCLVAPVVSRDLPWSWQPTDRVFGHKVVVVATDEPWWYGVLQCRLHDLWARALSSTLGTGVNYTPSRCYATYPLPPRTPEVARAADVLEAARDAACRDRGEGRSALHRRLRRGDRSADVERVRAAHEALDHAVLAAWGWTDLDLGDVDAVLTRLVEAG